MALIIRIGFWGSFMGPSELKNGFVLLYIKSYNKVSLRNNVGNYL